MVKKVIENKKEKGKKEEKRKKDKRVGRKKNIEKKDIYAIVAVFFIIFLLTFFISFKISKEKKIINYHNITFEKIKIKERIFYKADFYDLGKEKYTYYFYNNPYDLEKIRVDEKIELSNETYIFADSIDECENFYPAAVSFSVFLFKLGTHPEVRSISESYKEKYKNQNYTIIFIIQKKKFEKEKIVREGNKYYLYVDGCDMERVFERFLLQAYLDKKGFKK